ncbi:unnamed protein product [Eruca vesicaria subsp. sativa]|uniref:Uncharacterized protein n=1 Tax=Eruca vesicaria subsp. sativa TaxID=29727 RepID=A0ABC8JBQ6_ERUVS|nr:unnamed protein product [Eruca vesicaria subsp. sativa]
MHRREDDESRSSLPPPGICQRLFRFLVAKLGVFEEKVMNEDKSERNKLMKKRSRSDITVHLKQIHRRLEDNNKHKNK